MPDGPDRTKRGPTTTFATRDLVAKVVVGPRIVRSGMPVTVIRHWVEHGYIFTTGMKSCSILSFFFVNAIYFSYEIRLRSLKGPSIAVVEL
jgi:hypothetical protein